jgi:oxygen-dependent protoporphyrinogen oxidase
MTQGRPTTPATPSRPTTPATRRLVVVGAGITGLAAAFEWRRRRPDDEIVVLEAGDRIGGKLHRIELAGHWYDTGPEAMLARVPEAVDLVEALGLGDRLVAPATTQASVVLPDGRHPLPPGTVLGVPASADGLEGFLSPEGVARVRAEADLPPLTVDGDVAVGGLLRERLGDEVVDRLVEPLLGGVYAGRADELSVRATMPALAAHLPRERSVLGAAAAARDAGMRSRGDADGPVFVTLADGIGALPEALVAASGAIVRLRTPAHGLRRTSAGFELSVGPAAAPQLLTADTVLVTAPAAKAARLLGDVAPGAVAPLQGIPYASMAVVAMAFPAQDVDAGSGLLVPPLTGRLVKGVTVSSAKWPHLAGDALLVRSSVGRYRAESELQRSDEDLTAAVVADVVELLGLGRPEPLEIRIMRWGGGLPQYLVGHEVRVDAIRAAVSEVPGLAVAGAAFRGVGVPACIRDAHHAVETLLS